MATKAIVATKVGMTQLWDEDDRVVPVTMLRVEPCRVVQVKTPERDGYSAVQVTYGHRSPEKLTRPEAGHFANAGVEAGIKLVELRLDDVTDYQVGQEITVEVLEAGEKIDVTAVSKGKGFAGTMKRHNFKGMCASHGTERKHRGPGSIGGHATNRGFSGKLKKGKRMGGHMGAERVTVRSCQVVRIDAERNLLLVKGPVPGANQGQVQVRPAVRLNRSKAKAVSA
jgi:large subunit ribosomal protein L3